MTTIETLDAYAHTTDQAEADLYMAAYDKIYGIDPGPYWADMVSEYGVENTQYAERH